MHGLRRAFALGMGRGNVPSIGGFTAAEQDHVFRFAVQQKQRTRFADVDAIAVLAKRPTALSAQAFQAIKTIESEAAQSVYAAHQHHIAHIGL